MTELVDSLFPETEERDVLGGMTDFTGGKATKYFTNLDPEDREMVQWYLQQGFVYHGMIIYANGFAKHYAIIDPERKYRTAIDSAHQELRRIEKYFAIFLASDDFFPVVKTYPVPIKGENNKTDYIEEIGWDSFAPSRDFLNNYRIQVKEYFLPLFPFMHSFLDDPKGAPDHFDQDKILSKFREEQEFS